VLAKTESRFHPENLPKLRGADDACQDGRFGNGQEGSVSDVIDLAEVRERYRQERKIVHATARRLREIEEEIDLMSAQLALAGPLASHCARQPIGTIMRLDDDKLLTLNDPRVAALLALRDHIYETVKAIYELPKDKP
jgi:hypothetical protein